MSKLPVNYNQIENYTAQLPFFKTVLDFGIGFSLGYAISRVEKQHLGLQLLAGISSSGYVIMNRKIKEKLRYDLLHSKDDVEEVISDGIIVLGCIAGNFVGNLEHILYLSQNNFN